MLEQITGRRVTSFAYPYGAFSDIVRQCVIEAGYLSAVAAKNALARADDDIFSIARWSVQPTTTAERVAEVLSARGIPLSYRHERVRTAGRQLELLDAVHDLHCTTSGRSSPSRGPATHTRHTAAFR